MQHTFVRASSQKDSVSKNVSAKRGRTPCALGGLRSRAFISSLFAKPKLALVVEPSKLLISITATLLVFDRCGYENCSTRTTRCAAQEILFVDLSCVATPRPYYGRRLLFLLGGRGPPRYVRPCSRAFYATPAWSPHALNTAGGMKAEACGFHRRMRPFVRWDTTLCPS